MSYLRAFSRTICTDRELADDLTQETLCKAWASRASFRPGSNLKAWIFTILRNEHISYYRQSRHYKNWDEAAVRDTLTTEGDQSSSVELSDTVRAINMLTADQRDALILLSVGGYGYADVATLHNCPVGTIKSRVARGRDALSELLDGSQPTITVTSRPPKGHAADEIMNTLDYLMRGRLGGDLRSSANEIGPLPS